MAFSFSLIDRGLFGTLLSANRLVASDVAKLLAELIRDLVAGEVAQ